MDQSNEIHPDFADKEEAFIQRLVEECDCTRDEVINALMKEFFELIDQATDETQLTGVARLVKKAQIDAG
jgi:uncharacterized protein (DUF2267 family)